MTLAAMKAPASAEEWKPAHPHLRPLAFRSTAVTHAGCIRKLNEDAFLDRPDVGLWAVADGMGGHAAGDVASRLVVDSLDKVREFSSAFAFRRAVRTALLSANDRLRRLADDDLADVMGSTVVTLMAYGGHYACIWAGDSRAYMWRDGQLDRITRDHSVVQELVDAGQLNDTDAKRHKQANIVTRAVGAASQLDLEGVHGRIGPGDRILLCSDGIAAVLSDAELANCLAAHDGEQVVGALIAAALTRGAPDNVTVVHVEAVAA